MPVSLIYTTCPDENTAQVLSETLLQEKLVACTNIFPTIQSNYWWDGKLVTSKECVLILKTDLQLKPQLKQRFEDLHPYDVPCFLEIAVTSGAEPYLQWLQSFLK